MIYAGMAFSDREMLKAYKHVPVTSGWSGLISYDKRRSCRIRAQLLHRFLSVRFRDRCSGPQTVHAVM